MQKILIIRLSSMGDVLLTTPLVQALRVQYPDAVIDFAVKEQFAPLIQHNPDVNTLLIFDKSRDSLKRMRDTIRANNYNVILDLHNTFRSNYLKSHSGSATIRTLDKQYFKRFLLVNFKINVFGLSPPSILDRYAKTADGLLTEVPQRFPVVHIPDSVVNNAKLMLDRNNSRHIVVVPGSAHPTKEWAPERFGQTCAQLAKKYDASVYVLGGKANFQAGETICSLTGGKGINLAGKTSLLETAAIVKLSDLVITVDTGCMHIGWAFKKKMICIFGSTVKALGYYPEYSDARIVENNSLNCRPCSHNGKKRCPRGHFRCMNDITVEQVVRVGGEVLN